MSDVEALSKKSFWFRISALSVPALILLTPFVSFLKFQDYSLLSIEVAYIIGCVAVLSIVLGAIARWGGRLGSAIIVAGCLTLFADFQFEARLTYLAIGAVGLVVLGWLLARQLLPVLAAVFSVVLLSTFIVPAQPSDSGFVTISDKDIRSELPPVLHIILDEHIGIEGIERTTTWEKKAFSDLKSFYIESGFRLYGGAYANYADTFNSIPSFLNNTLPTKSWAYVKNGSDGLSAVEQNAYLRRYTERGYGVRVYQSKYFNFCEAPGIALLSCKSYNYTGLDNLDALTDKATVKAELVLARFLNRSRIYGLGRSVYQGLAARGFLNLRRIENNNFAPLASYPYFEILARDIAEGTGGQMFFAHLLIPHRPFMFDEACEVVIDHPFDHLERRSPEWLADYKRAYFEQVACTTKLMSGLFEALRAAGVYDRMAIVVHGDHGSRIGPFAPKTDTWTSFDLPMLRAQYSTLFAIKAPEIDAGYDDRLFSLRGLLAAVADWNGKAFDPVPDQEHVVLLEGREAGVLEKRPLPDFRSRDTDR